MVIGVLLAVVAISLAVGMVRALKSATTSPVETVPDEDKQAALAAAIDKLNALSPEISSLYATLDDLTSFDSGYLMKKDWDNALTLASPIMGELSQVPVEAIEACNSAEEIKSLMRWCRNPSYRDSRNRAYKAHELELCDTLLSNIDGGKSLDPQQREAIVTDEYSNLVIAGAGSGKTSVVVGKVKYLVERWGVDPSHILVTSFTRASVNDLKSRIELSGVHGVSARTFHALGLKVLSNEYAVAPEGALRRFVTQYLSNELASHPSQAAAFLEFFGLWNLMPEKSPDTEEAELRMKLLKAQDMRTLKGFVQESGYQGVTATLRGERVKSIEELMIANFLFLNSVNYEYEKPYPYAIPDELRDENRRAYQPDFYLVDYDIWLEHFGIDENERVPWIKTRVEEESYLGGMEWKRSVHKACGTRLIESYSYWNKDQDLLNRVEALLRKNGVVLHNDPVRNAEICGNLLRNERFFSSMSQLLSTFISLVKSGNRTRGEVDDTARMKYGTDGAMWHRYALFTEFAWPTMSAYQKSLSSGAKPMVDFDDMINKAAAQIRKEGYSEPYRYIIVDEYQDISLSRFGLLSAIRDATGAKLMCVGDDWQSIYRFAGSDVTLFTHFGKLVGYYEEMRIERTYRNTQKLVDAASRFVLKNQDQLRKVVTSSAPVQKCPPIAIVSLGDQRAAFTFALNDLLSSAGGGGEIKVLGRNRRDLERIFPGLEPTREFSFRSPRRGVIAEEKFDQVIEYKPDGARPKEIGYMTVHKSKGLQADNVIVIGLVNDRYGFPNMVVDDPILELLLADSDRYEFAEERRLFYVALTRTRNRVWLVTGDDSGYPGMSMFVDELHGECDESTLVFYCKDSADDSATCPRCGGVLLKRRGEYGEFVGCSNYPFCDKRYRDVRILEYKRRCPVCGGWLTKRSRRDGSGEFFGCTNYPTYCRYTMDIDDGAESSDEFSHPAQLDSAISTVGVSAEYDQSFTSAHSTGTDNTWTDDDVPASSVSVEYVRPNASRPNDKNAEPRCPQCGSKMVLRTGPHGQFYGCTQYPSCTGTRDYRAAGSSGSRTGSRKSKRSQYISRCPECGAEMVLRTSRYGKFYGCSNYPRCKGKRSYS